MDTQVAVTSMKLKHWAEIIKNCKDSGIAARQWLAQNDIPKGQYYYWYKRLKDAAVTSCAPTFHELKSLEPARGIISVPVSTASVSIEKNGYTISVRDGASRDTLRMVLEEIKYVK